MKSILSAAALLVALAAPSFAEEAATAPSQEPASEIIVPVVSEPPMSASPAETGDGTLPQSTAKKHGCGSKETVYLTN